MIAKLALEDGFIFTGRSFGAAGTSTGEIVFNTSMTGYQEVFTDPSYCGQIVTMTFPLIGNYGVNAEDIESKGAALSGFVIKELPRRPSNYRASGSLPDFLREHDIIGLCDIDTRALTRRLRIHGAVRGVISTEVLDDLRLVTMAREAPSMAGANLVERVAGAGLMVDIPASDGQASDWSEPLSAFSPGNGNASASGGHVVVLDCGIKYNILRHLRSAGCRVSVVPATTSADRIRDLSPDGLLVGNGPGDPEAVHTTIATLAALIGHVPIFGICLGHQMIALALGATTYKLKFGHHGANQPVLNRCADRVEITAQNHGFAVDAASIENVGGQVTHINLNDDSLEGFVHEDKQILAVQFHPEASPGPHDSAYVIERFAHAVSQGQRIGTDLLRPGAPAPARA